MAKGNIISTVAAAAKSYDLVTLADVKVELGLTDTSKDALLQAYITRLSQIASQYCNRVFVVETVLDEIWPARDHGPCIIKGGLAPLQLSRFPLVGVTSVVEDGVTLVQDVDYSIDAAKGQMVRLDVNGYPRTWPALAIAVTFVAGFAAVPADLADAMIRMIKARYFAQTRDPMLRQENIEGVYSATYWFASGPGSDGSMAPDIAAILDNYRVPVIA